MRSGCWRMKYKLTNIRDGVFAVFGSDKRAIAVDVNGDAARILFCDPDRQLILAAEAEAVRSGKKMMVCSLAPANNTMNDFLKENGYETKGGIGEIYTVDLAGLISSDTVKKIIKKGYEELIWIPFRDLMFYQALELSDAFQRFRIPIPKEELVRFHTDLSGVVYDRNNEISAFNLVSEAGEDLMVECLYAIKSDGGKAAMAAVAGMAAETEKLDISEDFNRLLLLESDEKVLSIIKKLTDGVCELKTAGRTVSARKNLGKRNLHRVLPEIVMDYDAGELIGGIVADKIAAIPFQNSINWKSSWNQ